MDIDKSKLHLSAKEIIKDIRSQIDLNTMPNIDFNNSPRQIDYDYIQKINNPNEANKELYPECLGEIDCNNRSINRNNRYESVERDVAYDREWREERVAAERRIMETERKIFSQLSKILKILET